MNKLSYLFSMLCCSLLWTCSFSQKPSENTAIWLGYEIDRSHLENRRDSFNMVQNEEVVGKWIWETTISETSISFKDISELYGRVKEEFICKVDKADLFTTSLDMVMTTPNNKMTVVLTRQSNKDLKATLVIYKPEEKSMVIDTTYKEPVIERSVLFGLVQTLPLEKSLDTDFPVFFMNTGQVGAMKLEKIGEEKVIVPAGSFDTYKLRFEGKDLVSNIIYVSKTSPRRIVKVDVIGQPLTIELAQ